MPGIRTINRYHFKVEWGGNSLNFIEVSGLEINIDVTTTRNGSSPENSEMKIPGITRYSDITLKRNIIQGDHQFYEWIKTNNFGVVEKRDISIHLLDQKHQPILTWKVRNAFPSKYIGPTLLANDSSLATESLILSHDGLSILT